MFNMGNITDSLMGGTPISQEDLRLAINGKLCAKTSDDSFKYYDAQQGALVDAMGMFIDGAESLLFAFPTNVLQEGDVIKKGKTFYQVLDASQPNKIQVVSLNTGAKSNIVKEQLIIGADKLYQVVRSLVSLGNGDGGMFGGNIGQIMMMQALMGGNKDGDGKGKDTLSELLKFQMLGSMFNGGAQQSQQPEQQFNPFGNLFAPQQQPVQPTQPTQPTFTADQVQDMIAKAVSQALAGQSQKDKEAL